MDVIRVITNLTPGLVLQSDEDPEVITRKSTFILLAILKREFQKAGQLFEIQGDLDHQPGLAIQVALALNKIAELASKELSESLSEQGTAGVVSKVDWVDQCTFVAELDCSPKFKPASSLVH